MTTAIARTSVGTAGRLVGGYYLLTIVTCAFVLFFHGRQAFTADLIATIVYLAVTAVFYGISKLLSGRRA